MSKIVSAIITTHNRSQLLKRAIESVLSQTYQHIECIVVDDNSTDDTQQVCAQFPAVKYIPLGQTNGHGSNRARNTGVANSTGDYIAFLDDDDCWLPEKIEQQMSLHERTNAEVIFCGRRNEVVHADGHITYRDVCPDSVFRGEVKEAIFSDIPTTTSTLFVTKKLFNTVSGFDEKLFFWQEYDLLIRMSLHTTFEFIDKPLIIYRLNPADSARLTNRYGPWKTAVKYVRDKHKERILALNRAQKARFELLVASDAFLRVKDSHNRWLANSVKLQYYYRILICKIHEHCS